MNVSVFHLVLNTERDGVFNDPIKLYSMQKRGIKKKP